MFQVLLELVIKEDMKKKDLERAISFAQKSTGSLGFYDQKMADEPQIKRKQKILPVTGNAKQEKKATLKTVNKIIKKNQGNINIEKAVKQTITKEQLERKRKRLTK